MRRLRRLVYVHWGGKMCEERCNHCLQIHKEALLRGWGSIFLGGWYKQAEDIMVLRCSREQLVKKYVGKLYNSSNSLVTEQAAKAGSRGTSTGDIQGRDESPICQGWFRCNQTCHNLQQWSGWCTRGLFSPKWVCDLSFVPNSVCGTVCANVCTWCLMFPYASAAQMSPGWYCLLVQALSLSVFFFLTHLLPLDMFLLHFYICFFLTLYFYVTSCLFVFISHILLCALLVMYMHLSLYTLTLLHAPCVSHLLPVLWWELRMEKCWLGGGFFLLWSELPTTTQFWSESCRDIWRWHWGAWSCDGTQ